MVTGLAIQMVAGVITIFGTPLPFTVPMTGTPGAATWALQLAQSQPGILDLNAVGDAVKIVNWTVRVGGTFTPHVQA